MFNFFTRSVARSSRILFIFILFQSLTVPISAQTSDSWVQVIETLELNTAIEFAEEIGESFENVAVFRTLLGSFAVVIGPMSSSEAESQGILIQQNPFDHPDYNFLVSKGFHYIEELPLSTLETLSHEISSPVPENQESYELKTPKTQTEETNFAIDQFFEFAPVKDDFIIQLGLKVLGFYNNKIDGILGSLSEQSIKQFQTSIQQNPTGVISPEQLSILRDSISQKLGNLELKTAINRDYGIRLAVPTGAFETVKLENPYIRLDTNKNEGFNLVIFNSDGGEDSLKAFYSGLLEHAKIPDDNSQITDNRFEILYANGELNFHARARLFDERLRGVIVYWSKEQSNWAGMISELITQSIVESSRNVISDSKETNEVSGQLTRVLKPTNSLEPSGTQSGFFLNSDGLIITSFDGVMDCERITVDFSHEAKLHTIIPEKGIAVLETNSQIAPLSPVVFEKTPLDENAHLYLGGYSFGKASNYALVSIGKNIERIRRNVSEADFVIQLNSTNGDNGGPLINSSGHVVGVLKGESILNRTLSGNLKFGLELESIMQDLENAEIEFQTGISNRSLPFSSIGQIVRDITLFIRCY